MTLLNVLRAAQRWLVVIGSVILVTAVVLGWRLYSADPVYEAQVKMQITAPQEEAVALFDRNRSASLRDEMTVARNNFMEILQSTEVYRRTLTELGLRNQDGVYTLHVSPMRDSDFFYITVQARTPELAEQIANKHVQEALAYFGEVRAKPATAAAGFISQQLESAESELEAARQALTDFKIEHRVSDLVSQIQLTQSAISQLQIEQDKQALSQNGQASTRQLIEQLQLERERAAARGDQPAVERYDSALERYRAELAREQPATTAQTNPLLEQHEAELRRLIGLEPMYNKLQEDVQSRLTEYELLQSKYTEAEIKENTVLSVGYIQVVEPAQAPETAAPTRARTILLLGLFGSLGVGLLLALLLDYLSTVFGARMPTSRAGLAPGSERVTMPLTQTRDI